MQLLQSMAMIASDGIASIGGFGQAMVLMAFSQSHYGIDGIDVVVVIGGIGHLMALGSILSVILWY